MIGYHPGSSKQNNVFSFLSKHQQTKPKTKIFQWVDPQSLVEWKSKSEFQADLKHVSLSYEDFIPMVQRTAFGYLELGIVKGDRAILFLPMGVELYTAMFALQMIGAIPVFLDSWARRGQLGATAKVVDPVAMISTAPAFAMTADLEEFKSIKWKIVQAAAAPSADFVWLQKLMTSSQLADPVALEKEHTALVTFTTGSSGVPKGANRSHRFLAAQHYAINKNLPYLDTDIDLPVFPIFSLNNIAAGVQTVIPAIDVGTQSPHDAALLLSQIFACQATCGTFSPSLLNSLVSFCKKSNRGLPLRRVAAGGAPISRDNVTDFCEVAPHAHLEILYGSTEVEPISHISNTQVLQLQNDPDNEIVEQGVPVGTIAEGLSFKIIAVHKGVVQIRQDADWDQWEMGQGEPGELIVAGEHVCGSYFNNEKAFETSKILDHTGTIWHRTGDVALIKEGCMWIVGRAHNSFVRSGKTQFPVRPEIVLKRIPNVVYGAYLGVPSADGIDMVATAVIVSANRTAPSEILVSEILRLFSKNKIDCDSIYLLEKLPLDPRHHSKVEYDVLRSEIVASRNLGLIWTRV